MLLKRAPPPRSGLALDGGPIVDRPLRQLRHREKYIAAPAADQSAPAFCLPVEGGSRYRLPTGERSMPRSPGHLLLSTLVAVGVAAPVRAELLCPDGEATLQAPLVRVRGLRGGRGAVAAPKSTFVVPDGLAIDPETEPIVFVVEADGVVLHRADLPAGSVGGRELRIRPRGAAYRLDARFTDIALPELASPPAHLKEVVKIGDDCFSAVLACGARRGRLRCRPERNAILRGRVLDGSRQPLAGAMVTVFDDTRLESVSVFSQPDGVFVFPPLRPADYRLRARLVGRRDLVREHVTVRRGPRVRLDLTMAPASADEIAQAMPATHWSAPLMARWPDPTVRGDFTLSCGNCHQIGSWRMRREKTLDQWNTVLGQMIANLPPYFPETRELLVPTVIGAYGPGATLDLPPPPPPPSGDTLRAVIYEYGLGDAQSRPGCHDLELGTDGVVYADSGILWIDPRTGNRGTYPMAGGGHSIERAPDGSMWITQAGNDRLAHLDVATGAVTYYPLPVLDGVQGSYPHTLRFDAQGRIWFTLTKSNQVASFDPATAEFTYHPLPEADGAEVGLPIPVAYGCDVAPDGTVWWSQLFGQRIGRYVPSTGHLDAWKPPFYGPRRLHADADGIVWVPGYGSGVLGRFDPATGRWKVYDLPTGVHGPPGYGTSEQPYSLNANRRTGEVWVNGSNSDSLIRFDARREAWTVFPLTTRISYTREIEFDPDNNAWTCTSNSTSEVGEPGRGRFVKVELPPRNAVCGDGVVGGGEECDDGNADDCDGCTTGCRLVTGCGDGVVCGAEACDDGNGDDCDGCSAACVVETGLRCGDGVLNATCGEECDPPEPGLCSPQCAVVTGCGNGVVDPGEACDDGDADDCNGCTTQCTTVTGCGDGVVCGAETCDDGNAASCDGCSATCEAEAGWVCGDGLVNAACGEACDPPGSGDCNWLCQSGPAAPLGTRHLSFGGALYTSPLGTATPLGTLTGALDLVAGAPGVDGVAPVTVTGPVFYRAPILGGSFGNFCIRIDGCTGIVDCTGGTAVDAEVVQDSAGPGVQGNPKVVTTGLGADGGPGAVLLSCQQTFVQTAPSVTDCTAVTYPAAEPAPYTTGRVEGRFDNAAALIGPGRIAVSGENFSCAAWTTEDGPGKLAATMLIESAPQAGDTANGAVLDD
jgi:virginiamycin B lyase